MMRYLSCLFFCLPFHLFAQPNATVLRAKVVDANTNEPLIGVHITYAGARFGTVTNVEGNFQMRLDAENLGDTLQLSYIGYNILKIPISPNFFAAPPDLFELTTASHALPSVEVEDVNAFSVIKRAADHISKNYQQQAYSMLGFYREENIQKRPFQRTILFTEGVLNVQKDEFKKNRLNIYDKVNLVKGYRRDLPFRLELEQDTIAVTPIRQGAYLPVRVDVVRSTDFLFNRNNYLRYNYTFEGFEFLGNRVLYRIAFRPKRNGTRTPYLGTIYIDKTSYAVVKADYRYTPFMVSYFNRTNPTNLYLQYRHFSCQYFDYQGLWYLEQANVQQTFLEEESGIPVEVMMTYVTTEVEPKARDMDKGKALYYDDVLASSVGAIPEDFWEDYIILRN